MERARLNEVLRRRFNSEILSPKEFRQMYEKNRDELESAEVIPPALGESGFGYVVVKRATLPKNDAIPSDAYDKLFSALADTPEEAVYEYQRLRNALTMFFTRKGVLPEEATDVTLDRVATMLSKGAVINNIRAFTFGVAKDVALEFGCYTRDEPLTSEDYLSLSNLKTASPEEEHLQDVLVNKLIRALDELPKADKELLLGYYEEFGTGARKRMAEEYGLSPVNLRAKVMRLSQKLRQRVLQES